MVPPFWYALSVRHRAELSQIGAERSYAAEISIVREGDETNFALVILEGCVKVSRHGTGGYQAILGLRNGGDLIGELAGMDGGRRSATLTTLTEVQALALPADPFRRFLRARPDVAETLHRTVSVRLREADRHRSAAGSETVPQRLAALLLDLGARYGERVDGDGIIIDLPLTQEDLAGLILTTHRTLGRVLAKWREQNLIVTGRRSMLLVSVSALREELA